MSQSTVRRIVACVIALAVVVVLGPAVSTQFVLAGLAGIGVDIPFDVRISTTWHDIVGMQPLFGAIFGLALLVGLLVAGVMVRLARVQRGMLYPIAGFSAFFCVLSLFNVIMGVLLSTKFDITLIAGARTFGGVFMLSLVGAVAGYVYAFFTPGNDKRVLFTGFHQSLN